MKGTFDFGMVGLGVMGRNFLLNVHDNGFKAIGLDLDQEKVEACKADGVHATTVSTEFIESLESPKRIMLLVPAGKAVDAVIDSLTPHLDEGDILIDGGNSFFKNTDQRLERLSSKGVLFMGMGVSGGAEGARKGPSMMPGGNEEAWKRLQPVLEKVAAKVGDDPCVAYMGPGSAGNYVKMVHNGIEYGIMQLISETYNFFKVFGGLKNEALHQIFSTWNQGKLQSFLVEITAEIFAQKDDLKDGHLVDAILDKGKQKGTGKWTSQHAMDLGIPVTIIDTAVSQRAISSFKKMRGEINAIYDGMPDLAAGDIEKWTGQAENALFFATILSYAQGFHMLDAASKEHEYNLDMERIAKIWRGGCIIRSTFLEDIRNAFKKDSNLPHLIYDEKVASILEETHKDARDVLKASIQAGVALPALAAAITYFDAIREKRSPMNLIQAQRDNFGGHTYERIDKEGVFTTQWGK